MAVFEPLSVAVNETMLISDGVETYYFKDVSIGEVWLAGGQYGAESYAKDDKNYLNSYYNENCSNLRIFNYPYPYYESMPDMYNELYSGRWRTENVDNLRGFSAIPFYFAQHLQESKNVPVGIIECNYPGAQACCWMNEIYAGDYCGMWLEDYMPELYYEMLNKIKHYTVRGFIWHQGDGNMVQPQMFDQELYGMIQCWREDWQEQLPFIVTQVIAADTDEAYLAVVEAQQRVCNRLRNVYYVSTGDIEYSYLLSLSEMDMIGKRIACVAREKVYKEDIKSDAPKAVSAVRNKHKIEIAFSNAENGLVLKDDAVAALEIYNSINNELKMKSYKIVADGNKLVIEFSEELCQEPLKILLKKMPGYNICLYNKADMPAIPFSIEV